MLLLWQVTFLHVHFQNTSCPVNKEEVIGFHACSHRTSIRIMPRDGNVHQQSNNARIRILNVKKSAGHQFCLNSVRLNEAHPRWVKFHITVLFNR
jgi:hypothetical protein